MKKALIFLILGTIAAAGYVYRDNIASQPHILPVTYQVKKSIFQIKDIEQSNVLFIGDQMGEKLANNIPEIIEKLSKNLQFPLKVSNLTRKNEGLHRTLAKLKQIPELPSAIIYHSGLSEFYERKFNIKQYNKILKNFETFEDETKISFIMTLPWLSKLLYRPVSIYNLDEDIKENKSVYPALYKMRQMELTYKFYNLELEELIRYIKEQDKSIILVTTPINLLLPPKKVCENTTSEAIEEEIFEFQQRFKKGESKLIISELQKYADATIGNAQAFYLLGEVYLSLARPTLALKALKQAALYDCISWRPSQVMNAIMRKKAKKYNLFLIDFAKDVQSNIGNNELFLHQEYPHGIYYQDVVDKLIVRIKTILDL